MNKNNNGFNDIQIRISKLLGKLTNNKNKNETDQEVINLLLDIQKNNPRFYDVFDYVQNGVVIYEVVDNGKDFKIVGFNPAAEKIENIEKKKIIGRRVTEVFPIVVEFGLFKVLQNVWKTGVAQHHPIAIYEDDIILVWRDSHVFKLPSGEIVVSYNDITKEKQIEAKIAQSEFNLVSLINNRNESIWSIDNDYNYIIINDFLKKVYFNKYKIELEVGINALDLLNKKEYDFWKSKYDRALLGEKFSFEYTTTINGNVCQTEVSLNPIISNKKITGVSAISTDVTSRNLAENKIRESEQKYRSIFENNKMIMFLVDPETQTIVDANLGAVKFYGWSRKEFYKMKVHKINMFKAKEAKKKIEGVKGEDKNYFELKHKKKDGSICDVSIVRGDIVIEGKKLFYILVNDITEQKKAEEAKKKIEEKYWNLLQFAPDAFVQGDSDGNFITCNEAAAKLTGYSIKELLKLSMNDLFSNSTLNKQPLRYDLLKANKVIQTVRELICKNGDIKTIEMNSKMMKNGTLQSFIRDVSERKVTENALRTSEKNFRLLFESYPLGTCVSDCKGNIIDGNKALLAMLGSPSLEATKKINVLKFQPLIKSGYAKLFRKCIKNNETLFFNMSYKSKWGKDSIYSNYLIPLSNEKGIVEKVYTIMEDVTQQKEAERNLRESEAIFRNLSDSTATAIFVYQNNKFVFANRATEVLTGYSKDELLKMNFWDVIHDEYKEKIKARGIARQKGANIQNRDQFKIVRKDGTIVWIDFTAGQINWRGDKAAIGSAFDITDRKTAENKLRESEEKYKLISDITSDYIYESKYNEHNVLVTSWVAGSFTKMTGYTLEEYNKVGGWTKLLHKEDVEIDKKAFNELLNNKNSIVEVRTYHKNGNIIWIKNTCSPIWDKKKNKLIGIIGAAEDITEEKQSLIIQEIHSHIANAIVKSQSVIELLEIVKRELHQVMNTTNFFIATYNEKDETLTSDIDSDEKDVIETWSAKKSISGLVINKKKSLFLYKKEILELMEKGKIEIIGTLAEVWFGVPLIIRGKAVGVMVVQDYYNKNAFDKASIDLFEIIGNQLSLYLERNRAKEDSLRLSRAISQSPVSIVITNKNGDIEYVNPKFEKVSGYTFEEVFGKNPRILKSGEQPEEYYKKLWDTILAGKDWRGEFLNKSKKNELYWENAVISPIANDNGEITHFVQIKEDITEKKEMIAELIKSKEMAEVSERIKTEFLAQMSHEIRSPLNVILSFVGLLKEDLGKNATEEMLYSFDSIDSASARIIRTIDLILNMTDLQIGSYESITKEINVVEILRTIELEYKQFAERKGLDLILNIKFDRKKIVSDEYALTQIISNLVDNAIKYSDRGYIEISAEKGGKRNLIIKVKDTGIGMSKEFLPNIFNSFSQEEQGYTRSYDGNGLGMALVKKYCDIIKAEVTVESKKGKGSTFSIVIPHLKG